MILAVMNNMNDKKKVLSKAKEIRNSIEDKYKTVFIRTDLNKKRTGPVDAETRRQPEQDLHNLPKRNHRDPVNTKAHTLHMYIETQHKYVTSMHDMH